MQRSRDQPHRRWRFNHQFWRTWSSDQTELTPLNWGCVSADCTRDPLSTFLSHTSTSNGCAHKIIAHEFCVLFHQRRLDKQSSTFPPLRKRAHVDQCGGFVVTTNPVDTVKGAVCPLLKAQELASRPQDCANGLDDAASVCSRALDGCIKLTGVNCTRLGVPSHTQRDPWGHPQR